MKVGYPRSTAEIGGSDHLRTLRGSVVLAVLSANCSINPTEELINSYALGIFFRLNSVAWSVT